MWIDDLQPFDFLVPGSQKYFRAVGWLSKGKAYPRGEVDAVWYAKLCELIQNPWTPIASAGVHHCELCRFTGGADSMFNKTLRVRAVSGLQVYVPGDGILFLAPVSIAHYIDSHEYLPPAEFQKAISDCPSMRSMDYLRLVLDNGGREFLAGLKSLMSPRS